MTTTKRRRLGLVGGAVALLTLLTGCGRMHMDVALYENDTVDMVITAGVADQFAQDFGMDPQTFWDLAMAEAGSSMPPGAAETPYAQDGYTGSVWTWTGMPLNTAGSGTPGQLSITREGDEFVVSGTLDRADLGLDDPTISMFSDEELDMRISVTFPGAVTDHNGTLDGTTVTWVPTSDTQTLDMYARGSAVGNGSAGGPAGGGSGGLGIWLWVIIGVAVLALLGVIAAVVASKKKNAKIPPYQAGGYGQQPYGAPGQYGAPQQPGQYGAPQQQPQQWGAMPQQQPGQQQWGAPQQQPGQYGGQQQSPWGSSSAEPPSQWPPSSPYGQ